MPSHHEQFTQLVTQLVLKQNHWSFSVLFRPSATVTNCTLFEEGWSSWRRTKTNPLAGVCLHRELLQADETMQLLTWLAAEIVYRLAAFSPGRGVAGTAYVHVLQKEPTQQLMPLVEEKILQLNFTSRVPLTPRAIANLVSLLYGSPTTHASPALTHLCSLAAEHLNSFEAAELVDLAAGLANCKKLEFNLLNQIRRALDAALTSLAKDERTKHQGSQQFQRFVRKNHLPEILAEFFETLVIAKPAGWSCATGVPSGNAKVNGIPLLSHILAASYEHVHILLPQIMAWHTDWMWRRVVLSWWGRPFEVIGDFAWSFLLRTWNDSTWRWCMALCCLRSKNWICLCDSFELPKRHKATKTRTATKTTTRPEIRPTRPTRPPRLTGVLRLSPALVALLFNLSR